MARKTPFKKTIAILVTGLMAVFAWPLVALGESGYNALTVPDVRNNSWARMGTVVAEAEPGALSNGELLIMRLSSQCKFYESSPAITGPVVSDTGSGQEITYTVRGDEKGQLRIVIPETVRGEPNDLFNAAGHDPFRIHSGHPNEIVLNLQNYASTFGENRMLVYIDEAYAVADEYGAVRLTFETMSGSGWPAGDLSVGGYDFVLPYAPTDLEARVSDSEVELAWKDNSPNEDGFIISMRKGTDSYKEIGRVAANTEKYTVTDLKPDTVYSFKVEAFNSNGRSVPAYLSNIRTLKPDQLIFRTDSDIYYVNGKKYQVDTAPVIRESRTLLPIRYIAEALGAQVQWNAAKEEISIALNGTEIRLWIGQPTAQVNGKDVPVDPDNPRVVPEIMEPGRTMVPLRFVSEALGCTVDWNPATGEITIKY